MPRSKSFDESIVLSQMMNVFWKQGYDATSMRHIEKATKLSAGSIYNEFGSKQKLFNRTLAFYIKTIIEQRIISYLQDYKPALEGVRLFILTTFIDVPKEYQGQSCLLVNTAAELGQSDELIGATVKRGLKEIDRALVSALEQAKNDKDLPANLDCQLAGMQLSLMLPGLLIASKNKVNPNQLTRIVDSSIEQLM